MLPTHRRSLVFASKTAGAALAAMLAALWLNLPNPGWAALTVFLTSQQLGAVSGSVISRSTYRVLGTLLAAFGILLLIPVLNVAPEVLILGVAAWVALLLYASLLDRSPRSYVFLLAAYTLPLIGMPLANSPQSAFDLSLWRVEEVALGAVISMVVHSIAAPRGVKPVLAARFKATIVDARHWIIQGLGANAADGLAAKARARLGADLAEARTLAAVLRFEPGITPQELGLATALEERLLALLPLLAGVEDRLAAVGPADERTLAGIEAHLEGVRRHLAQPFDAEEGKRLIAGLRAFVDTARPDLQDRDLLVLGAMERLAELVQVWDECLALMHHLEDPAAAPDEMVRALLSQASHRVLHVDRGVAAISGLAAAGAVTSAGALCWLLGWDQGTVTMGIAAVGCCLFAFIDDPRPFQKLMLMAGTAAVPVAALYVFAILPALDGYLSLALALTPLLFIDAFFLSMPKWAVPAIGFELVAVTLISVQPQQAGDFSSFVSTAIGTELGVVIALVVTSLTRVISAETSVRRLMHAAWQDLAAMAEGRSATLRFQWGSRMMDRIGLLLPRMAGARGVIRARAERAMDDLRMGVNVLDLRDVASQSDASMRSAIDAALKEVAAHFRQRLTRPDALPAPAAQDSIDRAISQLIAAAPSPRRAQALAAAAGLRLGLFPPGNAAVATAAQGAAS
ncbi:FUSC family protein [Variovorax sp. OV329]|uniref:FUSC family protein n=1 Tax=Variovorax sp. OV329 TaxID=1882825 RepID=UPI0008E04ACA|nr:FUSC family protein [Variovorax sp. OV329]SFM20468.1 Uncharacterized membrane protein YccC [Variovorax sp. OV329]